MTSPEEKRLFIGGLVKGVKEEELVEKFSRFGQVANVEIKTRTSDTDSKTFAYLNLTAEDNAFKKCFTAYNNTKWKGGQLKLQFAKESFLSKLKKEQVEAKVSKEKDKKGKATPVHKSPALESDRKAVPGTPMDEKGTWVMGKYSRVLPVLNLRKPGTRKIVTLDPSKLSHCVKKLKGDDYDAEKHSDLTWHLEENTSHINKLRQGQFPKMEAPRHHSTPKDPSDSKQDSIFSRLQGLAAEERVSDTEMEVVPVGKSGSVSKIRACSGYDSEDSAGSADTDDIVFKALGKKRSKPAVRDSVTAAEPKTKKKKKSVGRDDTLVNDESAASSNLSTPLEKLNGKKTTNSLGTRKEPHVKNRKLDIKDTNTEENKKPQFQFVKTPALKGKVLKKSAKLSRSETGSANKVDEHEGEAMKDHTPGDRRKSANKTPEFKGLGMLSSDSEDNLPPSRSVNKTPEFKGLGMLSSDTEDDQPPSRPNTAASFAAKSSGLGVQSFTDDISELESGSRTDSSFRALQKKKSKRAKPVSSEDSDLDDNDFEKVAKKLAARTFDKRQQGAGSGASFRSADGPNTTRKRTSSQAEDVQLTSLQKSHQAYNKIQQQQKEKEKIITKNLREGTTESKIVKFSDSDDEKGLEKKAAKMVLFSDGDSDSDAESDVDFSFRPQFEGSKGQKLFELQSRLKDKRFRFDERFQSSDSDEDQTMAPQESEDEMAAERKRNQDILEKVLGYKPRQRTRLVYEAMSQRRYNPDAVHSASEAKPEKRKKVNDSELRATPPRDGEPDDSEEGTEDSSSSDHMEQGVHGQSDSDQETDHDVDGHSDSEHTEQDSEEESDSKLAEHSAKAGERSGAECTVRGKDETSSAVKGQSLKGLFSGGSSFAFFGAPDGEGVNDLEEEDGEDEEEEEEDDEESELNESRAMSQRRYIPDAVHSASEAKPEKRKKVDDGKQRIAEPSDSDSDREQQTSKSDDSENTEEDSSSDHMEQDSDSEAVEDSGGDRTDEGKGLQGLFSGGSSFTLFGAPGGEGVKETAVFSDMEEDAEEDEEEEEEEGEEESELNECSVADSDRLRPPVQQQPSFMVSRDDPRLTAAVKFFKRPHEEEFAELCERWGEERQKIMELVRDRHKKACRKERQKKQGMQSRPFVKTKMQTHRKAKKW